MQRAIIEGTAIPILPTLDLEATLAFFERLGFEVCLRQIDPDVYAIVRREGVEIHFSGSADRHIAENSACYIRVDDAQGLYEEYLGLRIERLGPIEDKPWGMREFHLIDPSGNLIRIGQPMKPRAVSGI